MSPLNGLRERATRHGFDSFDDRDALALFLARARCAPDACDRLLKRFGSLSAVLGAPLADLAQEVAEGVAVDLKLMQTVCERLLCAPLRERTVITSWTQLLAYVRVALQHEAREQFRVLFLDKKNALIADEIMGRGTVDHAPVYPREIVRRALELNACAVILVHNHPSGDPRPSRQDIEMTREVVEACRVLRIAVHDHLVAGREGVASFKGLGLL